MSEQNTGDAVYTSTKVAYVYKVVLTARQRMHTLFCATMRPNAETTILDVGVTDDSTFVGSNYLEEFYPHKNRITAAGIVDASSLERKHPGLRFVLLEPHKPLPFADGQFDIVYSNAVIEHVGSREDQRKFIEECVRVGKQFFITTPNRWFPIEMHTRVPILHFLPPSIFRFILRIIGLKYWAEEAHLNLLDKASYKALFPTDIPVKVESISTLGFPSNLIAHGVNPRTGK